MMHLARLAGFQHEADATRACPCGSNDDANRATASSRGNGVFCACNAAVRRESGCSTCGDGRIGGGKQFFQRAFQIFSGTGILLSPCWGILPVCQAKMPDPLSAS